MPVLAAVWLLWWQDEGKVEKAWKALDKPVKIWDS